MLEATIKYLKKEREIIFSPAWLVDFPLFSIKHGVCYHGPKGLLLLLFERSQAGNRNG